MIILIKKWIKKIGANKADVNKAQPQKSEPSAANQKKHPPTTDGKGQVKKSNKPVQRQKKPKQKTTPKWDAAQYQVPVVEGKTSFKQLEVHDSLLQAVQGLGFDYCTPVQAKTLPHTLQGLDMIGKAQTGTGKTAAFLITIIDQILSHPLEDKRYHGEPRALIIAPTRELVVQIADDAKQLCACCDLRVVTLVGGEPSDKQMKQLDAGYVDILVATPGRLIDFIQQKNVYIDRIETLVLDEADRMLDMGFIPQVKQIVRNTPPKEQRQTLLFSATFTQDIINLSQQWTLNPSHVEIEPDSVATDTVEQLFYMVSDNEKLPFLQKLVQQPEIKHCIIFANRRDQCQWLFKRLERAGIKVAVLTGEVAQNKRTKTLADFKAGKIKILIATDVVGRGIHIDGITHVINFNLPQEPENYVHRIGRTGRAGAKGTAISLIGEEDAYDVAELETLLACKLSLMLPPEELL